MNALDTKLIRDLRRMKGQAVTIALVMALGIASFIALRGNHASLLAARDVYYENERFAHLFAHLERAPESLKERLESLEEVERVETRVVETARIPLPDDPQPIYARLVSIPPGGHAALNAVRLTRGRMPEPHAIDEALLLDAFAKAQNIEPGTELDAILNGKQRTLSIVGLAESPEFIVGFSPGDLAPEPERFAVLWIEREQIAATFQMEGAFNDVVLTLQPHASTPSAIASVDRILEPYGGVGALSRAKQPSSFFVEGELMQLEAMTTFVPMIFLAVAALLINIVLSRTVLLQRPQIAMLKAAGYSDLEVGAHFAKLVFVVAGVGSALGVALGLYMGDALMELYGGFFHFPDLRFVIDARSAATAVALTGGAAGLGALIAILRVVRLPPAEAMRPAAPAKYRRSIVDVLGVGALFGPAARMVVRELERRPIRTLMSSVAIASSVGLMVVAGWYFDGIDHMLHTQFHDVMREDVAVSFAKPTHERAIRELAHLPGVVQAEGLRAVPVRFHSGHRHRDGTIMGYPDGIEMRALRNADGEVVPLPPDGVILTNMLADILEVEVGDTIEVKVHDGERGRHEVVVNGLVNESFGLQGHMRLDSLRRALGETQLVSMGLLRIDPNQSAELDASLSTLPGVAGISRRKDIFERFEEQSAAMILAVAFIILVFAATITVGVVYNNARVALSMRSRDLASLRVLGFGRGEISGVLLGELALHVFVAIPLGLWFGTWLVHAAAGLTDPETYRLPVILTPKSYALAIVVALGASAVSALLVRRRLDHLDLISVLKTRE